MAIVMKPMELPLMFEQNSGQAEDGVYFIAKERGFTTYYKQDRILMGSGANKISLLFLEASESCHLEALEEVAYVNYMIGADPSKWITKTPLSHKLCYHNLYEGVDFICYGKDNHLEFDFAIQQGASVSQIRIQVDGAEEVLLDDDGNLVLSKREQKITMKRPYSYQILDSVKKEVVSNYVILSENQVGIEVGIYDKTSSLILDPILEYATYLGGMESQYGERASAIETDKEGNLYMVGYSSAPDFPVAHAYQPNKQGISNVVVSKIDRVSGTLLFSTYLGGSSTDFGSAITLDSVGNIYVVGSTSSSDFPTVNPLQQSLKGTQNAFVSKLSSDGSRLLYSTYFGGSEEDYGMGLVVDEEDAMYFCGYTSSADFPILYPYQSVLQGNKNSFVSKINCLGNQLMFSTYIGGNGMDMAMAMDLDDEKNSYVTGVTSSLNFPVKNAFQPTCGGNRDAFVLILGKQGNQLLYSTYFGGKEDDFSNDITVLEDGSFVIGGSTQSNNLSIVNPIQESLLGVSNGMFVKFSQLGSEVLTASYLGGSGFDYINCLSSDTEGSVVMTGGTTSLDFPMVNSIQSTNAGTTDVFISKMAKDFSKLEFSSYLGGTQVDIGNCVSCSGTGDIAVTGVTYSTNFPTVNAYQNSLCGSVDTFLINLSEVSGLIVTKITSEDESYVGEKLSYCITVTNENIGSIEGVIATDVIPEQCTFLDMSVSFGSFAVIGQRITWNIGTMGPNSIVTAMLYVKPTECALLKNEVLVSNTENTEEITASAITEIVQKLSTGPLLRSCGNLDNMKMKQNCVCVNTMYDVVSLIRNWNNEKISVNIILYDLDRLEEGAICNKKVIVYPMQSKAITIHHIPEKYEIVYDEVSMNVFINTTLEMKVFNGKSEVHCQEIASNSIHHTQLISMTNC